MLVQSMNYKNNNIFLYNMDEEDFFTKQILTYMGNKRKFLNKIDEIITLVKTELGEKNINIAEGFSGSGIVSRLFKNRVMSDTLLEKN